MNWKQTEAGQFLQLVIAGLPHADTLMRAMDLLEREIRNDELRDVIAATKAGTLGAKLAAESIPANNV